MGGAERRQELRRRQHRRTALPALVLLSALAAAALSAPGTAAHAEPGSAAVPYGGSEYTIQYDAEGMSVLGMSVDELFGALIMDVQVGGPGNGVIEVTLERAFLDARGDSGDGEFIVIYDGGEEAEVEELGGGGSEAASSRTIRFELPPGADEVTIVGTVLGGDPDPDAGAADPPDAAQDPDAESGADAGAADPPDAAQDPDAGAADPPDATPPTAADAADAADAAGRTRTVRRSLGRSRRGVREALRHGCRICGLV